MPIIAVLGEGGGWSGVEGWSAPPPQLSDTVDDVSSSEGVLGWELTDPWERLAGTGLFRRGMGLGLWAGEATEKCDNNYLFFH